MIISLSDPSEMNEKNFAGGYNVLTGEVDNHTANLKYGEVHTADACIGTVKRRLTCLLY